MACQRTGSHSAHATMDTAEFELRRRFEMPFARTDSEIQILRNGQRAMTDVDGRSCIETT